MNLANYKLLTPRFELCSKFLLICSVLLMITGCTKDAVEVELGKENSLQEKDLKHDGNRAISIYKGIFATKNSKFRGTLLLKAPRNLKDISMLDPEASCTITLQNGETFNAEVTSFKQQENTNKSSDVLVHFDSKDFSFDFTIDESDKPIISNVVFKNQEGSVVASEETATNNVTPITGTYKCTNCQDQDSPLNGIILNNEDRTFNMLLTTADGSTQIDIQALVVSLQETQVITQQNCSSNSDYTFCTYGSGINGANEDLDWSGVHRFSSNASGENCSTLAGNFAFRFANYGAIEGEFASDSSCKNNTYYVSSTGNDSNTGLSPEDPWQNLSKLNSVNFQPGDEIFLKGGDEFNGNIYLDSEDANNSANPISIKSYGSGKAEINAGTGFGIYAYNTSGIKIDNIIVKGSGMHTNTNSGISFYNDLPGNIKLDLIEVTNTEVYGFKEFGIVIGAWNGNSGYANVLIENNKVHDCLDAGISSYGEFSASKTGYAHRNIIVRNCEVFNIKGYDKGKHSGNGILLSDVQNSIIEHSTVYNSGSGNTNCGGPVGIWFWDADNVTIQYSEVYGMSSGTGCDGGGFDMDGGVTNGVMQYNYSHNNDGAGFMVGQFTGSRPMSNITIRYNVSENDAATNGGSVYLFNGNNGTMSDITVHNNTLYIEEKTTNNQAANIKYNVWKPVKNNIKFYNNILYAVNGADLISIPSGYDGYFAGNLYYTNSDFSILYKGDLYTSLSEFRTTGNEVYNNENSGLQANPLLKDPGNGGVVGRENNLSNLTSYLLESTSPAINGGIIISNPGRRDYFGTILSSSTDDIGAHEVDTSVKSYNVANK